jgi:hypothetical protein
MQYKPSGWHMIIQQEIINNELINIHKRKNKQFIREVNRVDEYNQKMLNRMEQSND